MWSRRNFDLRYGIIGTCLVITVLFFSNKVHNDLTNPWNFGPSQRAQGNQTAKAPVEDTPASEVLENETVHFDGLVEYVRKAANTTPNLLFLVLTEDASSWGNNKDKPPRTFHDFLELLIATDLDLSTASLALWTSNSDQYDLFRTATTPLNLARVSIFLDSGTTGSGRGDRHQEEQSNRRSKIAKFRNKLMLHAIGPEPHLVWIDSDIESLSPGIIQQMLSHSATNVDAGIITARCSQDDMYNYDLNAWSGSRTSEVGYVDSIDPVIAAEEEQMQYHNVEDLIKDTTDSDIVPLDTVGGTMLYLRASLVWQGLTFPTYYVVGTRWGRDGWDGIETEGLCYAARNMDGGNCFVLGGSHHTEHTDE